MPPHLKKAQDAADAAEAGKDGRLDWALACELKCIHMNVVNHVECVEMVDLKKSCDWYIHPPLLPYQHIIRRFFKMKMYRLESLGSISRNSISVDCDAQSVMLGFRLESIHFRIDTHSAY